MRLDSTAAAYGNFQVVFTDLTDHLAVATFRLRERKETSLTFEAVFGQRFKETLTQFRRELQQFDNRFPVSHSVATLRETCTLISTLSRWRNDRVHARVRMTEDGYALYDWRTRHRLEITQEQIEKNIQLTVKAIVELETHVPHLIGLLDWDEEFERLYSTVPELSEPAEDA